MSSKLALPVYPNKKGDMNKKDFLSITDISAEEIWQVLGMARKLKMELNNQGTNGKVLKNKTLVMIFEKPSLRTRLSFEIGMTQLGGRAIYLAPSDIGLGTREPACDIAKVISSMGDIIMARTFSHDTIKTLAKYSAVPVINGLSDLEHPCQILADLLTILEEKGKFKGLKLAYLGDADNNVTHSLALASGLLGIDFIAASPSGYWMKQGIAKLAQKLAKKSGGFISQTDNPKDAVLDADIVYTDTWMSMGDEAEKEQRLAVFQSYKVTKILMKFAKTDVIFMHDLPAYRGNEVQAEVIDGKQSVVFQQAENRLHVQKALMIYLSKNS